LTEEAVKPTARKMVEHFMLAWKGGLLNEGKDVLMKKRKDYEGVL